jgi:hypothetical protein
VKLFEFYSVYVVSVMILIPLLLGIINYRHLNKPLKTAFYLLLFSGATSLLNTILIYHQVNDIWMFNVFIIFELGFISLMYSYILPSSWKKAILILPFAFCTLCILNQLFVQKNAEINSYTRGLESLIVIGYGVLYINQQSLETLHKTWGENALNWVSTGLLIYFASTLFMFVFYNALIKAGQTVGLIVWTVADTMLILEYVLFAVGFYKSRNIVSNK